MKSDKGEYYRERRILSLITQELLLISCINSLIGQALTGIIYPRIGEG
jgi:hypothetical protein